MKIAIEDNLDEWLEKYSVPLTDIVHCHPVQDTFEHKLEGYYCWCSPTIKENGTFVVHNSFDGREFDEVEFKSV